MLHLKPQEISSSSGLRVVVECWEGGGAIEITHSGSVGAAKTEPRTDRFVFDGYGSLLHIHKSIWVDGERYAIYKEVSEDQRTSETR